MRTNLTQNQLDQLAELITFGEYKDGVLFIKDVRGDVYGNVKGNVFGSVEGDVYDDVGGSVGGSVIGNVHGKIAGKYWTSLEYKDS